MKRIFLILTVILILLTGCTNSTELSDTPTESIPAIVITETVTTPTTENEDPKGTTDNADAVSSFSASKETVTTEPEETVSETKPPVTTEQPATTEKRKRHLPRPPKQNPLKQLLSRRKPNPQKHSRLSNRRRIYPKQPHQLIIKPSLRKNRQPNVKRKHPKQQSRSKPLTLIIGSALQKTMHRAKVLYWMLPQSIVGTVLSKQVHIVFTLKGISKAD